MQLYKWKLIQKNGKINEMNTNYILICLFFIPYFLFFIANQAWVDQELDANKENYLLFVCLLFLTLANGTSVT